MEQNQTNKLHNHVLIVGGGSDLMPRLRDVDKRVKTSVICRASVKQFVHKMEDNQAVIVLNDNSDVETWVKHAKSLHSINPIDAVVSFAEIDQDKAAAISEALKSNFYSTSTIEWVHDKSKMRRRLKDTFAEGLPSELVYSAEEVIKFGENAGYPLILKPSKGRASAGISIVTNPSEAEQAFKSTKNVVVPRLEASPTLVEPYLEGKEFSVEALSESGEHIILAIVEKYKDEESKVEIGHCLPARLSKEEKEQIEKHVSKVLDSLDISFGITHTELILTSQGPHIIETHVRAAGDEIPELIKDSLGLDPLDYVVKQAAGLPILEEIKLKLQDAKTNQKSTAIWFASVNIKGKIKSVKGLDEAKQVSGVSEVFQLLDNGSEISPLSSSYSRIAFSRSVANSQKEALEIAQKSIDKLKIELEVGSSNLNE
ncbi:ATP-grasp domain-containing protein [Priestia megaterium]|uniref:ATP-grasp domain-containing protein n=1 Tax=Priestia megaterium TaxID=1404 RepID=UPI0011A7F81A|nr:ATP-grasp domain-containing protein [Priestia megaterium]